MRDGPPGLPGRPPRPGHRPSRSWPRRSAAARPDGARARRTRRISGPRSSTSTSSSISWGRTRSRAAVTTRRRRSASCSLICWRLKARGARTLVECTPPGSGRDPTLLVRLSEASGLHVVTNTGYYARRRTSTCPRMRSRRARRRSPSAGRRSGATGSRAPASGRGSSRRVSIRARSPRDRPQLIVAASLCHRRTGLRIHCHTGDGRAAMDILSVLDAQRVSPAAFVWACTRRTRRTALSTRGAARAGAWIELDGVAELTAGARVGGDGPRARGTARASPALAGCGLVPRGRNWGGRFRPYTYLFDAFRPRCGVPA